MSSAWTVPAGLRLLLDDIIRALLEDASTTTTRLDERQLCRLVADFLDTWLDQRAQLELVASQHRDSGQSRNKSIKNRNDEDREDISAATKGIG